MRQFFCEWCDKRLWNLERTLWGTTFGLKESQGFIEPTDRGVIITIQLFVDEPPVDLCFCHEHGFEFMEQLRALVQSHRLDE